jgi:hypothetical protein
MKKKEIEERWRKTDRQCWELNEERKELQKEIKKLKTKLDDNIY